MLRLRGLEAWTPIGRGIYFLGNADGKSAINFFDLKTKEVRRRSELWNRIEFF